MQGWRKKRDGSAHSLFTHSNHTPPTSSSHSLRSPPRQPLSTTQFFTQSNPTLPASIKSLFTQSNHTIANSCQSLQSDHTQLHNSSNSLFAHSIPTRPSSSNPTPPPSLRSQWSGRGSGRRPSSSLSTLEFNQPLSINERNGREQNFNRENGHIASELVASNSIFLPPPIPTITTTATTFATTTTTFQNHGSHGFTNGSIARPKSQQLITVAPTILQTVLPPMDTRSISSFSEHDGGMGSSRADLVAEDDDNNDGDGGECGWLCLRPRFLQKATTAKWVLFWLCWAAAVQGMVVNGFVNVCITTIEKRFDLRSTDTGLIAGAYDMASVLCSVPVSYLGSRPGSSKPRWLGWGMFIMGIGSFVFTLPHFLAPIYSPNSNSGTASIILCLQEGTRDSQCKVLVENWLSSFRHIFVMGQFLHGVGATPLYTLGVTYLDESVPIKMSSVYLGIFYGMAVVGPAAGYVLGGQFLKVYVDSPNIHSTRFDVDPASDLWLGAWWIGFLLSGTLSFLISWPIMAFPGQLPGAKAVKAARVSEAYSAGEAVHGGAGSFGRLKDLPQAAKVLAVNPTFIALSLAGATEGILLAGFATFTPKFLENQFSMPASLAALIVGFVAVPAGGGGTFLGGWIIKRLHLSCSGILKMCIIGSFICLLSCFTFVISCPNIHFSGVNSEYNNRSITPTLPNLTASCNVQCQCDDIPYDPVCGINNVMYFSPCHAGCTDVKISNDGIKVFTGCNCVASPQTLTTSGIEIDPRLAPDSAIREKCPATCSLMPVFLVIFFIIMLITFTISLPALSGTLRCVPDSHRSLALGLQWIVVRLLGTIPGPILFGALFDNTCTLWQSTCGKKGACRSYDNFYMSRYMMSISILFKFLSTILFFLSWWLYKSPSSPPDPTSTTNNAAVAPMDIQHNASSVKNTSTREPKGIDNPAVDLT